MDVCGEKPKMWSLDSTFRGKKLRKQMTSEPTGRPRTSLSRFDQIGVLMCGVPFGDEVPELQALRSARGAAPTEVQDALAPYWETWKDQPQKATVVLRRLAEEKIPLALVVLECMGLNQVEINIRHWNPVIFEMSKTDDWQRSLELLLLAMSSRILPDNQSFSSICNAASKAEAWQLATDALQEMFRLQLQVDERIHNIVASSCKSQWLVAMHVLDEMKSTGLGPDAISFSTVCSALSDAAWPLALGLLEAAGRHAVEVDVTNYGATIDVLDEWQQVMSLLAEMKRRLVELNLPAFNAALAADSSWFKMLALLRQMAPNQLSISTALSTLARHRKWTTSLRLMGALVHLRQFQFQFDSGVHPFSHNN